ncbi:hypothetical protein CPB83DRAFT_850241 [Crepidotus variabilis]|uniref:polynucleotide adenylyltransferase n=1 Tax=Crepidotus variabilis TaxID=179855 RepID=A0A9P6JSP5_9AGAR|nr:hypothetical protein CPB83DRAFT_850241 [Crepidotus variabilis]
MSYLGDLLKNNLMANRPTRCKSAGDYIGQPIPPCGDSARSENTHIDLPPWYSKESSSLHRDIVVFMEYLEPTAKEKRLRADLVRRFTSLIESFGINATVCPVGSYVTGLYVPTSDIDMVLAFKQNLLSRNGYETSFYPLRNGLYDILQKIQKSGFARRVEDVLGASTPLLRIIDKKTGLQIDLTASDNHGINATNAVQKWMGDDTEKLIKTLVTVVKMFLSIRRCGTTYTGGINSYVLVWMVVAWVKLEWPKIRKNCMLQPSPEAELAAALRGLSIASGPSNSRVTAVGKLDKNLTRNVDFGYALRKFFKFYGFEFDYYHQAISIEPTPTYKSKPRAYGLHTYGGGQPYLLSIFDPANATEDMGKKAYAIKHIQASFKEAYELIIKLKRDTRSQTSSFSFLGTVLGGDFSYFVQERRALNI